MYNDDLNAETLNIEIHYINTNAIKKALTEMSRAKQEVKMTYPLT